MERATPPSSSLWNTAREDFGQLWNDPPLDSDIREQVARQAVHWVLFPCMCATIIAALLVAATVGISATTRFVPLLVFALPCFAVYRLKRAERPIAAAAVFCGAATLSVVSAVLLHGVRAPAYDLGVLVLLFVVTLFGLRSAVVAALAILGAGGVWLVLDAQGLSLDVAAPTLPLVFGLRVLVILLALALIGGPQLLLTKALREANYERQRAEQAHLASLASERAFQAVFDQSSVALALLTADGRIKQLNPRAQAFLEPQGDSLIGCSFADSWRWSEEQGELLHRAVGQAAVGQVSHHELTLPRSAAAPDVHQIVMSPFLASAGCVAHVLVEIVDVSDLVETRSMLAQARRLEALGKLSGGVAHDMNNMFAAILGGCELVRLAGTDTKKIGDHVRLIQSSVQRGATLTKQLLAFGRKDRWNSEQLDVNRLLQEVSRLLERTLKKNIELAFTASEQPIYVRGDSAALEHALLNLALNAQDAMPSGGTLALACRTTVLDRAACRQLRDLEPGRYVIVTVEDTGGGMSPDVQERIFEPFFTTKPPGEGTGLGLAAVHGTMRAHHGVVSVSSELGAGTCVELVLPAIDPLPVARIPLASEILVPARLNARVLLADDEVLAREVLVEMLQSAGCQVQAVVDGTALVEALAIGEEPDIIVTDLAMPGLDGSSLVRTLEAMRPGCALLLMTGYTGDDVAKACPPRSGRKLLRKPFPRAELLATVAELLAQAPANTHIPDIHAWGGAQPVRMR